MRAEKCVCVGGAPMMRPTMARFIMRLSCDDEWQCVEGPPLTGGGRGWERTFSALMVSSMTPTSSSIEILPSPSLSAVLSLSFSTGRRSIPSMALMWKEVPLGPARRARRERRAASGVRWIHRRITERVPLGLGLLGQRRDLIDACDRDLGEVDLVVLALATRLVNVHDRHRCSSLGPISAHTRARRVVIKGGGDDEA